MALRMAPGRQGFIRSMRAGCFAGTDLQMMVHQSRHDVTMPSRDRASPVGVNTATALVANAAIAIKLLNRVMATIRMTALRCERGYLIARRLHFAPLAAAALEHAQDARTHCDRIGRRISDLGGVVAQPPDDALLDAGPERIDAENLLHAVITADRLAAHATIRGYRKIAAFVARFDPRTSWLLEEVIGDETRWAENLAVLLGERSTRVTH